jgi:Na+/H+ antiporter NhaD/arsenite permease-like protein
MEVWIAATVFVAAYVLIALERIDRTLIALLAGLLLVVLGVIDQHDAFAAIDLNVILLLAGMMVMASIISKTGLFEWLALYSLRITHGRPLPLLLILCAVTAALSAFLDNVTTVVLLVPVTLSVTRRLDVSPLPYLISQILASNIGGTATLIGDPPNILIGSAAGLNFNDFLVNLAPVTIVIFVVFIGLMALFFRRGLKVPTERREQALEATADTAITNRPLLIKSLIVLGLTLIGFLAHQALGLEAATIALLGATVLMLIASVDPHEALGEVEWKTLFFFVGLFVLVEAVIEVGIVDGVGEWLVGVVGDDVGVASVAMLWVSAGASAIIDNIPYTASAIPLVRHLVESGLPADPLWWSLALGACLGGNLTIVGASANVVVATTAARAGHPIGFWRFLRYGAVVTFVSLAIATIYVYIAYLR